MDINLDVLIFQRKEKAPWLLALLGLHDVFNMVAEFRNERDNCDVGLLTQKNGGSSKGWLVKLEDRIMHFVAQRDGCVVLRSDLRALCTSESQLSRMLNKLMERKVIERISRGAFVKTKINKFTGDFTPAATLEVVAKELFERLNIKTAPPPGVELYNAGLPTQVPAGRRVVVQGRKITRKITVAGQTIRYVQSKKLAQVTLQSLISASETDILNLVD